MHSLTKFVHYKTWLKQRYGKRPTNDIVQAIENRPVLVSRDIEESSNQGSHLHRDGTHNTDPVVEIVNQESHLWSHLTTLFTPSHRWFQERTFSWIEQPDRRGGPCAMLGRLTRELELHKMWNSWHPSHTSLAMLLHCSMLPILQVASAVVALVLASLGNSCRCTILKWTLPGIPRSKPPVGLASGTTHRVYGNTKIGEETSWTESQQHVVICFHTRTTSISDLPLEL